MTQSSFVFDAPPPEPPPPSPPAPTPPAPAQLLTPHEMAQRLDQDPDFRVLRRLVPVRRLQEQPSGLLSELANGIYESIRQIG